MLLARYILVGAAGLTTCYIQGRGSLRQIHSDQVHARNEDEGRTPAAGLDGERVSGLGGGLPPSAGLSENVGPGIPNTPPPVTYT